MLDLTKTRTTLVAKNQIYRAQLNGNLLTTPLSLEQGERLLATFDELNSRVATAQLEVDQLTRQFYQTDIKLISTKDTLKMNEGILDNITPLMTGLWTKRLEKSSQCYC